MPPIHDDTICLRQWDWSETSQTAIIFCRDHGVLRVLAKGSKRPVQTYSGGLEILTRALAGVILRPNTELALLTEWDLTQTFPALRTNLAAHNTGLYVADLLQHAVRDQDPHPVLWDTTLRTLESLGGRASQSSVTIPTALLRFQWSLLVECGYRPVIDADARTGRPLPSTAALGFSAATGGFVALDDHPTQTDSTSNPQPPAPWRVRASTLALLRQIDTPAPPAPSDQAQSLSAATPDSLTRANRLLAAYLRHTLGDEPPTMRVVFPTRLPR